jgi:hypothetical protein
MLRRWCFPGADSNRWNQGKTDAFFIVILHKKRMPVGVSK